MTIEVEIPDALFADWGGAPETVRKRLQLELAVYLYASGKVSAGRAAEVANCSRGTFEEALGSSGIERNFSLDDLEKDLEWSRAGAV